MKTKFIAIFVAGLMGLGTLTVSAEKTPSKGCVPGGPITIVKGEIYDWGNDYTWDMVTFGIKTSSPWQWYRITAVELTDMGGNPIVRNVSLSCLGGFNQIKWYGIQLGRHGIVGDFLMKVHVSTKWGGDAAPIYIRAADPGSGEPPKDPEETIIVVKWP